MEQSIIIYDGDCAFCTWCVSFVLKRDKTKQFLFTPLSGETATTFFSRQQLTNTEMIWLIDKTGPYFYKSDATLRIVGRLGGVYRLAYLGLVVPRVVRDWCYGYISARRKRLIAHNVCPIIPTEHQDRFIP